MNIRLYLITSTISITFFNSCSSINEIVGTYKGDKAYTTMQINADSTFFYRYKFEFSQRHADGFWRKTGRREITLNSAIKNRTLPLEIHTSKQDKTSGKVNLSVNFLHLPDKEMPFYLCSVFINDQYYVTKRCDSLSTITILLPVNNIYFGISGNENIPGRFLDTLYTQKGFPDKTATNFTAIVDFKDSLFNYRVFDNDILKVTKKSLKIGSKYGRETLRKVK